MCFVFFFAFNKYTKQSTIPMQTNTHTHKQTWSEAVTDKFIFYLTSGLMSKYFAHFTGCLAGSARVCVCVCARVRAYAFHCVRPLLARSYWFLLPLCFVPCLLSLSLWFGCLLPFFLPFLQFPPPSFVLFCHLLYIMQATNIDIISALLSAAFAAFGNPF